MRWLIVFCLSMIAGLFFFGMLARGEGVSASSRARAAWAWVTVDGKVVVAEEAPSPKAVEAPKGCTCSEGANCHCAKEALAEKQEAVEAKPAESQVLPDFFPVAAPVSNCHCGPQCGCPGKAGFACTCHSASQNAVWSGPSRRVFSGRRCRGGG